MLHDAPLLFVGMSLGSNAALVMLEQVQKRY